MKVYIFFAILILGFFAVITAAVRPDIVEAKYMELRAPYDQRVAAQQRQTWEEAKNHERAKWMLKLELPNDCNKSSSSLRELECKNIIELHHQQFARAWNTKVRNGWKPEGLTE